MLIRRITGGNLHLFVEIVLRKVGMTNHNVHRAELAEEREKLIIEFVVVYIISAILAAISEWYVRTENQHLILLVCYILKVLLKPLVLLRGKTCLISPAASILL